MDELREAFEAAYEEATEREAEDAPEIKEEETQEALESATDSADSRKASEAEASSEAEPEPKIAENDEKPETTTAEPTEKLTKAPVSWSPNAREEWAKIPAKAQDNILRREREVNKVLQESKIARTAVEQLNRTLEPYRQGLIAAGVQDPIQAVGALLKTESTLRNGTQLEKSKMLASLINQYSVDIETLDSILAGENPQSQNNQLEQLLNEKLAPFNQFMQSQNQLAQQNAFTQQQSAQSEIEEFSQNAEFLQDVRNDMADLLEMAAQRGVQLTLQDAYNKACALHPEVSAIIASREKEQRIMNGNQEAQRKKAASVSITGKKAGEGAPANLSLRDELSQAWNEQIG